MTCMFISNALQIRKKPVVVNDPNGENVEMLFSYNFILIIKYNQLLFLCRSGT